METVVQMLRLGFLVRMGDKGRCAGKLDVMNTASLVVQGSDASIRLSQVSEIDDTLH